MNKKTQISLLRSMPDVCYIMRHNSDNMWIYHGVFDKIIKDIVRLVRVQKMRREILSSQQSPRFQYPSVYNQYFISSSSSTTNATIAKVNNLVIMYFIIFIL